MTYVIGYGCCNDASCADVCPVDCIRPRPGDPQFTTAEQLYIDPGVCIECGACAEACPVDAIYFDHDMPAEQKVYADLARDYFVHNPITDWQRHVPAPPDDDAGRLLRVAIIGSGPAASYAAMELAARYKASVSIFERLPTPHGLVRSGVAPDHLSTKRIAEQFEAVLSNPRVRCYFNVEIGRDIALPDLLESHHAVIIATGAGHDRTLDALDGGRSASVPARTFVGWYNGHPDQRDLDFDFSCKRAVVVGNGNVALDVARILASPVERLRTSDIADHALEALAESRIREVVVVGRRGPADAAFTLPEFASLSQSEGIDLEIDFQDGQAGPTGQDNVSGRVAAMRSIMTGRARTEMRVPSRIVRFRFMMEPVRVHASDGSVSAVEFRTAGEGRLGTEIIETGLLIAAIGSRGSGFDGVPFDERKGLIPNAGGRVLEKPDGPPVQGLYCAGWVKRGANGGIGTNRYCSGETVARLIEDYGAGRLEPPRGTIDEFERLVKDRCVDRIDLQGWQRIDQAERHRGSAQGRQRRKFVEREEMIAAALGRSAALEPGSPREGRDRA